jgi:hypothetical protein
MKYYLLFTLCLITKFSVSQNISGQVKSIDGDILNAVLLFRESSSLKPLKEYAYVHNGFFSKQLQNTYDTLYIEVKSQGYNNETLKIENLKKDKTYYYNFVLTKIKQYELEEVIIVSKKKRFEVKVDTISFNVSRYIDGSERKIEEIISKLPGIEVNEQSGEIKYKGKSVETVTLDGDNLFGFNYTLGTKNINVDMVEQIEAIDNYAENPLLKGIDQGGKVSLNLKLKQGKIDLSGNLDFGSGYFNTDNQSFNVGSNILGITKNYKSFATLSYNNVGVNQTPFDYFSFSYNLEQQKEQNLFAEKIIPETRFSNLLEDKRVNINNQLFGNYNAIFKINPKLSVKTNLYYLKDRITTNQFFENKFEINNENFTTSDNTFITKKPQQYRGDLEIKYNTSKSSLLEYNLRIRKENIETPTTVVQNQTDEFTTFLKTEDFYLKQDLLFTKKISKKNALQLSLFHSLNDLFQRYTIKPSLFNDISVNDVQESHFRKTFLEGKATYLGSSKKDKYTFTVGANLNTSPFNSRLFNSEETASENSFDYTQTNIFNTGIYNINRGDWQISPSYAVRFLNQNLNQNIVNQKQSKVNFIFEPTLKMKYTLNSVSFLTGNLGYNQNTNAEQYFFLNQILINNRTSIKNLPSLKLQKSQRYSLLYFNNDLYNQFLFNANVSFKRLTGNFFTNSNITAYTTQIEYFFLPQDNSNWNMNLQVSKYIPFIESTIKLTSNYSTSNFKNIVNNSDLRQNQNQFFSNAFFWKTAFDIPINFENNFTWQYSNSKSKNQQAFVNNFRKNNFRIIVNPNKKWFFILSTDYYLPDTNKSNEYFLFLDATLRHRPKNKKWEASLEYRNITNENNFEQIQTSDISTTIFRSNILPMYFLVNLTWNF